MKTLTLLALSLALAPLLVLAAIGAQLERWPLLAAGCTLLAVAIATGNYLIGGFWQ